MADELKLTLSFAGSNTNPKGIVSPHRHRGVEVIYLKSGKCLIEVDGQTLPGESGSAFVLPSGGYHKRHNLTLCQTHYAVFDLALGAFDCHFRSIDTHSDEMLKRWFEDLVVLSLNSESAMGEALLIAILLRITYFERLWTRPGHSHPAIKKVVSHIIQHCSEGLDINTLTRVAGLSQSHLNKLFRQAFGIGTKQYLFQYQMQLARQFLKDHSKTVAEVAYSCGFADPHYFASAFRKIHCVTPSEFRNDIFRRGDLPDEA